MVYTSSSNLQDAVPKPAGLGDHFTEETILAEARFDLFDAAKDLIHATFIERATVKTVVRNELGINVDATYRSQIKK